MIWDKKRVTNIISKLDNNKFRRDPHFRKSIANNFKMIFVCAHVGLIKSDIYAVKTSSLYMKIELWGKYTTGNIDLESIKDDHWIALGKGNDDFYINIINKVVSKNRNFNK